MITRPLGLQERLSPLPRNLDPLFWVNVGAVVLFFMLLGSRFVLATGERIDLPKSGKAVPAAASVVVSYKRDDMVLFEGGIFEVRGLRAPLEAYAKQHPGAVMLVRADQQVSAQALMKLFNLAQEAGFTHVLLAAEPQAPGEAGANGEER